MAVGGRMRSTYQVLFLKCRTRCQHLDQLFTLVFHRVSWSNCRGCDCHMTDHVIEIAPPTHFQRGQG